MVNQRQKQALETRQHLLDVGIQLIETRGYDNVKVEDITSACGVAVGTFYHHFKSKDEFYFAQAGADFAAISAGVLNRAQNLPLRENIERFLQEWFAGIRALSPEYLACWLGHASDSQYHEVVNGVSDTGRMHEEMLEAGFRVYVKSGTLPERAPIQKTAQFLMIAIYGLDVRYCMTQGSVNLDAWISPLVDACMAMIECS